LQENNLRHEWRQNTKGILDPFMEQGDQGLGENTLRWGKPTEESEIPVLGTLISPKNSKIPRRNQGITNEGLGVTLMVVLERKREREREREK
jgi:hypothetical protein